MKSFSLFIRHSLFVSAFFILVGCASYQSAISGARDLLQQRQFDEAIEVLKEKANKPGGDQLAYLLEYATALHQAGRYEESNKAFLAADKLADENDYTSISRTAGTYVVNESMAQYKAETFEYLLINVYQALNYMMLGDYENAQVMSRRITEKLKKIEIDQESKKLQTSFASYLSALIWEAQGDWDNAYVLYNKAFEGAPDMEQYQRDLLISAKRAGRSDTYEKLKKKWPEIDRSIAWDKMRGSGELVFIFQQGWIPRKQPRPENRKLPYMVPVLGESRRATVQIDGGNSVMSQTVFDLEHVSVVTLNEDYKRLVAKALARSAARQAVIMSAGHNRDNKALNAAAVAAFIMDVTETADLRQWSMLPARFQVIRAYVSPGEHKVTVTPVMANPNLTVSPLWDGEIKVLKGQKIFKTQRAF